MTSKIPPLSFPSTQVALEADASLKKTLTLILRASPSDKKGQMDPIDRIKHEISSIADRATLHLSPDDVVKSSVWQEEVLAAEVSLEDPEQMNYLAELICWGLCDLSLEEKLQEELRALLETIVPQGYTAALFEHEYRVIFEQAVLVDKVEKVAHRVIDAANATSANIQVRCERTKQTIHSDVLEAEASCEKREKRVLVNERKTLSAAHGLSSVLKRIEKK
jgi:hypothetical protein